MSRELQALTGRSPRALLQNAASTLVAVRSVQDRRGAGAIESMPAMASVGRTPGTPGR
jgi:hypothetical protein